MDHDGRDAGGAESATVRDHLANERTLLAWVRTALTIIGLGFLVGRLFVEEGNGVTAAPILGAALVVLGGLTSLLAAYRFVRIRRDIETASFRPSSWPDLVLSLAVAVAAIVLAVYLIGTG